MVKSPAAEKAPPLTLLVGDDEALIDEEIARIEARVFCAADERRLNRAVYASGDAPLSEILTHASTAPFLAEKRLVILREAERLAEPDRPALLAHLKTPPPFAVWILVSAVKPARSTFVSELSRLARLVNCEAPRDEYRIKIWISRRFAAEGKKPDPEAIEALVGAFGRDLASLKKRIEQLCILAAGRPRVTREDVEKIGGGSAVLGAFEVFDAVLAGRFEEAYAAVRLLLENGAAPQEILSALAYRFERAFKINGLLAGGTAPAEIARLLKIHPYFAAREIEEARRLNRKEADAWLKAFGECDRAMKRGVLDGKIALEKLLLDLGELKTARKA